MRVQLLAGVSLAVVSVSAAHASDVALDAEQRNVEVIVVSATGYAQDIERAPASMTVVDRDSLARREVLNITDAVSGIEGVNARPFDARSGKTGNQSISLRGLPSEYTLVLIDGVRQNTSGTVAPNAFGDSATVFFPPVAAIERVEVIRGPMSTLYGSDAMGGVVNVITRDPGASWTGSAALSGTFQSKSEFGGTSMAEGYVSGPLAETLSFTGYARLFQRDDSSIQIPGLDPFDPQRLVESATMGQNPVGADVATLGGRLDFTPMQGQRVSLRYDRTDQTYNNDRGQVGGLHNLSGSEGPCSQGSVNDPNFCRGYLRELEFNREQIRLSHEGEFAFGTVSTSLTRDFVETVGRTIPANSGLALEAEGRPRTLELETWILDSRLVSELGAHTLTVGGQYLDPELTDGLFGGGSAAVSQYSLFIEDSWALTDRFSLTGGLRYDESEAFSGRLTPRLYAVWAATDEWTFKGGVGRGYRTPFVEQLTDGIIGFGNRGTTSIFGNPDLNPERSTNYEASALFNNGRLAAQATVFRNELTDLIEAGTGANAGRTLNIGEAVIQGVELAGSFQFTGTVRMAGNYTFTDSEVTESQLNPSSAASLVGDPLVSVPDHMANATVFWDATERLTAFLGAEYRSSAYRPRNYHEPQDGGSAQGAFEALGAFRGYTQLNLGAAFQISDTVRLNAVVYNLLDRNFIDYREYARRGNPDQILTSNVYNTILEPRRLYVSLGVDF
ncbi:TonB-dependent receptor [Glycocaulis profundi]|nr:TonB-dependent receptor [Glycocaulis profundi]